MKNKEIKAVLSISCLSENYLPLTIPVALVFLMPVCIHRLILTGYSIFNGSLRSSSSQVTCYIDLPRYCYTPYNPRTCMSVVCPSITGSRDSTMALWSINQLHTHKQILADYTPILDPIFYFSNHPTPPADCGERVRSLAYHEDKFVRLMIGTGYHCRIGNSCKALLMHFSYLSSIVCFYVIAHHHTCT